MSATAKLFMHGRSQAVRLPKDCRFDGVEVRATRVGDKVILEPVRPTDVRDLWSAIDSVGDADFMPEGREQPAPPADRASFDP